MKILVLGAGTIGVATAYYLAKQGHSVTVIERLGASAMETSYANAGQISYGYSSPWAAPGVPLKAIKWLFDKHPPLSIKPDGSLFQISWILQMWRNCTGARYAVNKERLLRISQYSKKCLSELRDSTNIQYEGREGGTIQLFRTSEQLNTAKQDMRALASAGVKHELLSPEELIKIEPGLANARVKLLGGLRTPEDETGDCHIFTTRLAKLAEDLGVTFHYNTNIKELIVENGTVKGIACHGTDFKADAVVVALGSWSTRLLADHVKIPVYPLKGYSITAEVANNTKAPQSTMLDESYKVAVTRFDSRIRVGGMAEIKGFDKSLNKKREATLKLVLDDLFPGSYVDGDLSFWTGLRPKTPDSTPIIGATQINGLYLNTGHGTLGWTMACGSGRLLADIISGTPTEIKSDDLSVSRYQ